MPTTTILLLLLLFAVSADAHYHHRHLLHQPFFPLTSFPPLLPPSISPQQQPKYPFSSTPTIPANPSSKPFFPKLPSPPPPPPPSSLTSFPANISSILFPHSAGGGSSFSRHKLLAIALSLSLLSAALIFALAAFLLHYRRRHHHLNDPTKPSQSDSLRLFPPNTSTSDAHHHHLHKPPNTSSTTTSSEFLYLGTLINSRGADEENASDSSNLTRLSGSGYRKLGSPELKPLPPLPRHNLKQNSRNAEVGLSGNEQDDDEEEEFFSPRGSSGRKEDNPAHTDSSPRRVFGGSEAENFGSRSWNSRTPSYPSLNSVSPSNSISSTSSLPVNLSPRSLKSKSPDSIIDFMAPSRPAPPPPRQKTPSNSSPERDSGNTQNSPARNSDFSGQSRQSPTKIEGVSTPFVPKKLPPPPPAPPPPRFWEAPVVQRPNWVPNSGPPGFVMPSRPVVSQILGPILLTEQSQNNENEEKNEEISKPKLKPLHWDKVRASSDRAMVWDQLKSSSFQLNEEMIETLFMVNNSSLTPNGRRQIIQPANQENQVLDPKKSQNIAILLRALNVTIDEVCEALLEGNTDTLGTELLESLLKMAPTKEEERKLKEFKDGSPFKLGPAEKFLKVVLDIPFAFKRVDAMLYIANFDSEVEYLNRSFETLEAACQELRKSRMFLKLLEAVLKTGNRMNVGTNRGDAHAFKLDTLLKLVDVKGADGKTTLLHFVVQEIIRAEGSHLSSASKSLVTEQQTQQSDFRDDVEFRKLGLQVVAGLSGELTNVKKAAAMDSDVLSNEVSKLASGISKIVEVVKLNEEEDIASKESSRKFSESMNGFLKKAEEDIIRIQAQESVASSLVKELTEYFHGNSAKEEAHPFRIFLVVRDFLSTLDQVCKEVGKINERTIVSSARQFPAPAYPTLLPVFPGFSGNRQYGSSDDESSSSS